MPQPKLVDCPFCGQRGERSAEHVWAKWMRATPGAKALLETSHGEQIPRPDGIIGRSSDGRYIVRSEPLGRYAKYLPNVTVWVCKTCNNGWMSDLEKSAKAILAPFILSGSKSTLDAGQLQVLATWVTKSWMAYALTRPTQANPFTITEYRAMAAAPAPLDRSRIWMFHSEDPRAHVAMGIASTLLSTGETAPDLEHTPDNAGHAYFAVGTVVMTMALLPEGAPAELDQILTPPAMAAPMVQQAWPNPQIGPFPQTPMPSDGISAFMAYPEEFRMHMSLPMLGLTDAEVQEALDLWFAGAEPRHLHGLSSRAPIVKRIGLALLRAWLRVRGERSK